MCYSRKGDATVYIQESFVDQTRGVRLWEDGPYETWTDDIKQLFCQAQREYGRCISKVYVDGSTVGDVRAVGWVFEKKLQYENSQDLYTQEVWCVLFQTLDIVTRKRRYHYLS